MYICLYKSITLIWIKFEEIKNLTWPGLNAIQVHACQQNKFKLSTFGINIIQLIYEIFARDDNSVFK